MSDVALSLEDVLERTGMAARWEARAEARVKEKEALAIAQNMINMGFPEETIISATKLDPGKVKKLFTDTNQNLNN